MVFVSLERKKADILTREKKAWLMEQEIDTMCWLNDSQLKRLHAKCHMSVDRTLYLARRVDFDATRQSIQKAVGVNSLTLLKVCTSTETSWQSTTGDYWQWM